jgi:ATP-binding protein involved in chromosome partitioning
VATKEQVEAVLDKVMVPVVMRSVMELNLLRGVEIKDNRMKISLSNAALADDVRDSLRNEIQDKLRGMEGIDVVAVDYEDSRPIDINKVGKIIAVMSGKGGVGKSLVTGLLAVSMKRQGKTVGILDADITGPSIPKMFGIDSRPSGSENGLLPVVTKTGIEIMSINLLLPNEDDAVIWRGPIISKSIQQFWEDVLWGTLDYLIVDMPPGTADVPLTVMQSIPLAGVVIAFSPQDLTAMIVRKAVKMAQQMNVPVLGVVENMSYFLIPGTENRIEIFGPSKAAEMAKSIGSPILGKIPLDPELARLCDRGELEQYDSGPFKELQEAATRVLA